MSIVSIAGRKVGAGAPCLIVAEAGVNHNGNLRTALDLVDAAAACGADAVKFQTFRTGELATKAAPKAGYQRKSGNPRESQYRMLEKLELPGAAFRKIKNRCARRGIIFLSTPFDRASAELLSEMDVAAFKIGSGEITNLPFVSHVAGLGKPLILSTGMSSLAEARAAVAAARCAGNRQVVVLHCVSSYPAAPRDVNLRAMSALAKAFGAPVGFSDHTLGTAIAVAAVALGACVIEKHLTLDRRQDGPDHRISLEPSEMAVLVSQIRAVEAAMGDGVKQPAGCEAAIAAVARRSLTAARHVPKGARLAEADLVAKRPGTGLPPAMLGRLIGRVARIAIPKGAMVRMEMIE